MSLLSPTRKAYLDCLIFDFNEADEVYNGSDNDTDSIIDKIRTIFGDKIATEVDNGSGIAMARSYNKPRDYKKDVVDSNVYTKSGKMNKNSIKKMKNFYKSNR